MRFGKDYRLDDKEFNSRQGNDGIYYLHHGV
jgi:hypothetical protein